MLPTLSVFHKCHHTNTRLAYGSHRILHFYSRLRAKRQSGRPAILAALHADLHYQHGVLCYECLQQHHMGKALLVTNMLQRTIADIWQQEADRLWFEDRIPGVPSTHIAIFGI
jgi:hypothetical protein